MLAIERQTLLEQATRAKGIGLVQRQRTSAVDDSGAGERRAVRAGHRQQRCQPLTTFVQIASHLPEVPEHARQAERRVDVALSHQPVQSSAEVRLVDREAFRPRRCLGLDPSASACSASAR